MYCNIEELRDVLKAAQNGGDEFTPEGLKLIENVFDHRLRMKINFDNPFELTAKELLTVALSLIFSSVKDRCFVMGVSKSTFGTHEERLRNKLGCDTKLMAVGVVISNHIIKLFS